MQHKLETKEKFHELILEEPVLTANMTEDLRRLLGSLVEIMPKNAVVSLRGVNEVSEAAGVVLAEVQTRHYEKGASMVFCEMQDTVEESLEQMGLLEMMNVAPTLSEAWDIVQMEEIERELMDGWE